LRGSAFVVAVAAILISFSGHAEDNAALDPASRDLGISLPMSVITNPIIAKQLSALGREKCDRQAVFQLSEKLEDESYRREAAESLAKFSDNCGGYAEGLRRAINLLLDLSDYQRSAELADKLIEMEPNNDNGYFLRAVAYGESDRCEEAIADYSSAIELFGDKDKISSVAYENMSKCYENLGQYCDAMLPIESWVAIDPGAHDNDQTRSILRRLSHNGQCAQANTGTKEERIRRKGGNVIMTDALINGVKGKFMIDTGATFVTVKKQFAEKAGLAMTGGQTVRLNTANGAVDGYLTRARSVKLRSLESKTVQVVIQSDGEDDYGDNVDGLIGMSFLSRYDVALDAKTLRIRPRK
jgi:aspartyl protease family protein